MICILSFMASPIEVHPIVANLWKDTGFDGWTVIDRIQATQEGYQLGEITNKRTAVGLLAADFIYLLRGMDEDARRTGINRVQKKYNTDLVLPQNVSTLASNSLGRRLGTSIVTDDVACAIFHPEIGIAIADEEIFTEESISPTLDIVLDKHNFNIAGKIVGRNQLAMHQWIAPDQAMGIISYTIAQAIAAFNSLTGEATSPTGTSLTLIGLDPWEGVFLPGSSWEEVTAQAAYNAGWDDAFDSYPHFQIDLEQFRQSYGVVYGGRQDLQYSEPHYFTIV